MLSWRPLHISGHHHQMSPYSNVVTKRDCVPCELTPSNQQIMQSTIQHYTCKALTTLENERNFGIFYITHQHNRKITYLAPL
jgi:hypothetical protein